MIRSCLNAIFKKRQTNQPSKAAQTPRKRNKNFGCFSSCFKIKNQDDNRHVVLDQSQLEQPGTLMRFRSIVIANRHQRRHTIY